MAQKSDLDDEERVQHMLVEQIDGLIAAKEQGKGEEVQAHRSSSAVAYANVLNVDLEEALEDRVKGEPVFQDRDRIPALDYET